MFTRVKEFKSLMSVLFWLVLPRLKQKKIAEYLPKLLGDIELSIKNQGQVNFSKSHIAHLVFCLDDTKLTKPVMVSVHPCRLLLYGRLCVEVKMPRLTTFSFSLFSVLSSIRSDRDLNLTILGLNHLFRFSLAPQKDILCQLF